MNTKLNLTACTLAAALSVSATATFAQSLELFQTKPEAVATMDALIAEFEAENPDIDITQVQTPEPGTVLRSRIVRRNMPDIIALGGDSTFADLADARVLKEQSENPVLGSIQTAYVKMISDLHEEDGVYGLPYSANANTVLYNTELFEKNGWSVPHTWDELIALAEDAKAKGITPFYHTYLDPWTILVPFNAIAANEQPEGFVAKRKAGETTFAESYGPVVGKLLALLDYGTNDNFGRSYDDGNRAMANGEAAMLIQGVWAIPAIKSFNPDVQLGAFAFPVGNDAEKNKLVSGVDTLFAVSEMTSYPEAAQKFIDFMMRPENAQRFIDEQKQFSAVKGVYQKDPVFAEIARYFETGMLASFPDHYFPAGMQLATLAQEFLLNEDPEEFLAVLDREWDAVSNR